MLLTEILNRTEESLNKGMDKKNEESYQETPGGVSDQHLDFVRDEEKSIVKVGDTLSSCKMLDHVQTLYNCMISKYEQFTRNKNDVRSDQRVSVGGSICMDID